MKMPRGITKFNKRYLNPLLGKIARSSWGPFCIVYHVGRRSGKPYETLIIAFPTTDGFVIALTYGREVDWYRNVSAAGCCRILWHRQVYPIDQIVPLEPKTALTYLPRFFKTVLGMVHLQDYIKMTGPKPQPNP